MNVIGPQACHKHIGLRLFLDYIVKGSEEISKKLPAIYCKVFGSRRVYGQIQYMYITVYFMGAWNYEKSPITSRKDRAEKNHSITVECLGFFATSKEHFEPQLYYLHRQTAS